MDADGGRINAAVDAVHLLPSAAPESAAVRTLGALLAADAKPAVALLQVGENITARQCQLTHWAGYEVLQSPQQAQSAVI